jgi:hypothetical protein
VITLVLNGRLDTGHAKHGNTMQYQDKTLALLSDIKASIGINYFKIIPKPPSDGSESTKKDLKELEQLTSSLSNEDIRLIYSVNREPRDLFDRYLMAFRLKVPQQLLVNIYNYFDVIITDLKYLHNRTRPISLSEIHNVKINVYKSEEDTNQTPSYPSQHSAYAYCIAQMCSRLFPDHKQQLFRIADRCGEAKILQGVNYRSDIQASKQLVSKLYNKVTELRNQNQLKKLTQGVKHEL